MALSNWLRNTFERALERRASSQPSSKPRKRRSRPVLEWLEERVTPDGAHFTVTSALDSGPGTLRQAIIDANAAPNLPAGPDVIDFAIGTGAASIAVASALPALTDAVTIDGSTQPGFAGVPLIELNGAGAGSASGLVVLASNTTIRGLVINRFSGNGILVNATSNAWIHGNYIGTDVTGTAALGNGQSGVLLTAGASGNIVGTNGDGTADAAEGNLIAGNGSTGTWAGVQITGAGSDHNVVAGNRLGTTANGNGALPNSYGVIVSQGARYNRIGTDGDGVSDTAERNLISGNTASGIWLEEVGTNYNRIAGNYIGTNAMGNSFLRNGGFGVLLRNGPSYNWIGTNGDGVGDAIEGNVISGNTSYGVIVTGVIGKALIGNVVAGNFIGTNAAGTAALGNLQRGVVVSSFAQQNVVGTNGDGTGDAYEGNVISGNLSFAAVQVSGTATFNNVVAGNRIGTNAAGSAVLGNVGVGVYVFAGAYDNRIGTNADGRSDVLERNVVAGTTSDGVRIGDGIRIEGTGTTSNTVAGNYVGTDITGTLDFGNAGRGVLIQTGAANNTIGGSVAGARNIISGNDGAGIEITGSGSNFNVLAGNYIGLNAGGTAAIGNNVGGVRIRLGAQSNRIGTNADGVNDENERNVISGNLASDGVYIRDTGTQFNVVAGNYLGTDFTGLLSIPNGFSGVSLLADSQMNRVGTDGLKGSVLNAVERNIISGNGLDGIFVGPASNSTIAGNYIGVNAAGAPLSNGATGIILADGANNLTIGSNLDGQGDADERNIISANATIGILITGSAARLNKIVGNYIGTDVTGTLDVGNSGVGLQIEQGAHDNTVGGTVSGAGNVISGNGLVGTFVPGLIIVHAGTTGNLVAGNHIGTNAAGTAAVPNGHDGVLIWQGATNNTIGGTTMAARNVISGNGWSGVEIAGSGTTNNVVLGNYIGLNAAGTSALTNSGAGVAIAFGASGNTVGVAGAGNVISGNVYEGVGFYQPGCDGNVVMGNLIGTDYTGTLAVGNGGNGVGIFPGASFNLIGTNGDGVNDAAEGNVISGNSGNGVAIFGASDNVVAGNAIGTDSTGTLGLGNGGSGITIGGAANNRIGTNGDGVDDAAEGNIISANAGNGVFVTGQGTTNNVIAGNRIGTNAAGTAKLANGVIGVLVIDGADDTRIGTDGNGVGDGVEGNLISGNFYDGITVEGATTDRTIIAGNFIGTNVAGNAAIPNGSGITVRFGAQATRIGTDNGDLNERNVISGNLYYGIAVQTPQWDGSLPAGGVKTSGTVIAGNLIGLNLAGSAALANGGDGVAIQYDATNTTVGGGAAGMGNVISGNASNGVNLLAASGNIVAGNFIGTDSTGTLPVGNGANGIAIGGGAANNRIGTNGDGVNDATEGNTISANAVFGVLLFGQGTNNTVIAGNRIGTNAAGTAGLGSYIHGILVTDGADDTRIGTDGNGTADGVEGNVVSNTLYGGIVVEGAATDRTVIAGNFIGTNAAGDGAIANGGVGVEVRFGAQGTRIGTDNGDSNERNVISGNAGYGIVVQTPQYDGTLPAGGVKTSGTVIAGNFIGLNSSGSAVLGNSADGVAIAFDATNTTVGGTMAGMGNVIRGNAGNGVTVYAAAGNPIRGNSIFDNAGLGIDLDSGNNGLTSPTLTGAVLGSSNRFTGTLNNPASTNTVLDFFLNSSADGEGERYIGSATVPAGQSTFDITLPGTNTTGNWVSATATDAVGNTSEFSGAVVAVTEVNHPVTAINDRFTVARGAGPVRLAVLGNDYDPDGDNLFIFAVGPTAQGGTVTITSGGTGLTYTPPAGLAVLVDSFIYTVSDGRGSTATAAVEVRIDPNAVQVDPASGTVAADLQAAVNAAAQSATATAVLLNVDATNLGTALEAAEDLAAPAMPVDVVFYVNYGTYAGLTIDLPANVTLVIAGSAATETEGGPKTVFQGASPALTVATGEVFVKDVTLTNATDAPTVLVTGGRLVIRHTTVTTTTGSAQAAIAIQGGYVDLGTTADPGGNTLATLAGQLIVNTGGTVVAGGNTLKVGSITLPSFAALYHNAAQTSPVAGAVLTASSLTLGPVSLTNAAVTLGAGQLGFAGDVNLPLVGGVHLAGTIQGGGQYSVSALLPNFAIAGFGLTGASVTLDTSGLHVAGDASLPLVGGVHLTGTLQNGQYRLTVPLPNVTVGAFALTDASVTLSNSGLNLSGNANLPLIGTVPLTGPVQDSSHYTLSIPLPSASVAGLAWSNAVVTLSGSGLDFKGTVRLPVLQKDVFLDGTIQDANHYRFSAPLPDVSVGPFALLNATVTLSEAGLKVTADADLPLLHVVEDLEGLIQDGAPLSLAVTLPSASVAGLAWSNAVVTLGEGGLGFKGNVHLPVVQKDVLLDGTIQDADHYHLSAPLPGVSVGPFALLNATVTLSNAGLKVTADADLPLLDLVEDLEGLIQDGAPLSLSVGLDDVTIGVFSLTNNTITLSDEGLEVSGDADLPIFAQVTFKGRIHPDGSFDISVPLVQEGETIPLLDGLLVIDAGELILKPDEIKVTAHASIAGLDDIGDVGATFTGSIFADGNYSVSAAVRAHIAGFDISGINLTLGSETLGVDFKYDVDPIGELTFKGSYGPDGHWALGITFPDEVEVPIGPVVLSHLGGTLTDVSLTLHAKATVADLKAFVDADLSATIYYDGRFEATVDIDVLEIGEFQLGEAIVTFGNTDPETHELNPGGEFVLTVEAVIGIEDGPNVHLDGYIKSGGDYFLEGDSEFDIASLSLGDAHFKLAKGQGFSFGVHWDYGVFVGDVSGSIGSDGRVQFHGNGDGKIAGFTIATVHVDVDLNPAGGHFSIGLGGSVDLKFVEVAFDVSLTFDVGGWAPFKFETPKNLPAPLSTLFPGTVTIKVDKDGATFDSSFHSPFAPLAFDVHAIVTNDGTVDVEGDAELPVLLTTHLKGHADATGTYSFSADLNSPLFGVTLGELTLDNHGCRVGGTLLGFSLDLTITSTSISANVGAPKYGVSLGTLTITSDGASLGAKVLGLDFTLTASSTGISGNVGASKYGVTLGTLTFNSSNASLGAKVLGLDFTLTASSTGISGNVGASKYGVTLGTLTFNSSNASLGAKVLGLDFTLTASSTGISGNVGASKYGVTLGTLTFNSSNASLGAKVLGLDFTLTASSTGISGNVGASKYGVTLGTLTFNSSNASLGAKVLGLDFTLTASSTGISGNVGASKYGVTLGTLTFNSSNASLGAKVLGLDFTLTASSTGISGNVGASKYGVTLGTLTFNSSNASLGAKVLGLDFTLTASSTGISGNVGASKYGVTLGTLTFNSSNASLGAKVLGLDFTLTASSTGISGNVGASKYGVTLGTLTFNSSNASLGAKVLGLDFTLTASSTGISGNVGASKYGVTLGTLTFNSSNASLGAKVLGLDFTLTASSTGISGNVGASKYGVTLGTLTFNSSNASLGAKVLGLDFTLTASSTGISGNVGASKYGVTLGTLTFNSSNASLGAKVLGLDFTLTASSTGISGNVGASKYGVTLGTLTFNSSNASLGAKVLGLDFTLTASSTGISGNVGASKYGVTLGTLTFNSSNASLGAKVLGLDFTLTASSTGISGNVGASKYGVTLGTLTFNSSNASLGAKVLGLSFSLTVTNTSISGNVAASKYGVTLGTLTLTSSGASVAADLPVVGSYSMTVNSTSFTVSVNRTFFGITVGTVTLSSTGLTFTGSVTIPIVGYTYVVSGSVNSNSLSLSGIAGSFSSPGANDLARLWRALGAGWSSIANALYNMGAGLNMYNVAKALSSAKANFYEVARAVANPDGLNLGFYAAAKVLYKSAGLDLTFYDTARALYYGDGLDLTFYEVAKALYKSAGLDLSAADTARALYFSEGIDRTATDVARALYKSSGLDLSLGATVDALVEAGIKGYTAALKLVKSINGYLEGSIVFFDANINGVLDPNEEWAVTAADGSAKLVIAEVLDGVLDDDEGQWVVHGGVDTSTGLPAVTTLVAPASWEVITPLTNLVSTLTASYSQTVTEAVGRVLQALGLPELDLGSFDPIARTLAGDANGPLLFAAHAKIQDTIAQSVAVFAAQAGAPPKDELAEMVVDVFAGQIAGAATALDLSNASVIATMVRSLSASTGIVVNAQLVAAASTVIAGTNQAVDALAPSTDLQFLEHVSQVKIASQAAVAADLALAATGQLTLPALMENNTGDALAARIAAAVAPPVLTLPDDIVVEATGPNGAEVSFTTLAHDIGGQPLPVTSNIASGSSFPLGETIVTATARDSLGNTVSASFTVTVVDTGRPFISLPPELVVEATGPEGAFVILPTAVATDIVDPSPLVTFDHPSGNFLLGKMLVTATATDASGNHSSASFYLNVVDTTPPLVSAPANLVVEATDLGGAVLVLPGATATDLVDPSPVLVYDFASGFFPLGTTVVTLTAIDAAGNAGMATFTVTVVDTTPPVVSAPADLVIEANVPGGAVVALLDATVTDVADPSPLVTYDVSSGILPLGTTVVTVTAIDAAGNSSNATFAVTVRDTTTPEFLLPEELVVEATGLAGAVVTLPAAAATDLADLNPLVTYSLPSGLFPVGTTLVTATATDAAGNTSTMTFAVTVVDTTPPVLSAPADLIVVATEPDGAMVTLPAVTATDLADPSPQVAYSFAPGLFPLGTTLVTVTATDASGNTSSATFTVTVVDGTSTVPVIAAITPTGDLHAEGTAVTVTGRAISRATLATTTGITYIWAACKDGMATPFATSTGVDAPSFSFTPDDDGSYRVMLTVADATGASATDETTLFIENALPQVGFSYRREGPTIQLTGVVHDASPADEQAGFSYAWEVTRNGDPFAAETNGTGVFSFIPDGDGVYAVTLAVTDKDGGTATVTHTVSVAAPVAADGSVETAEDTPFDGVLSATDGDGDALTYSMVDGPGHGSVVVNADGSFHYTPDADYDGSDRFTFLASDGYGDSNTATVTIAVTPVNDAPVALAGSLETAEDAPARGRLSARDGDGDALTYSLVDGPSHGSVVVNADGTFVYTPEPDYSAEDSFSFLASDGTADSEPVTVTVTVTPVNDAPTAQDDNRTLDEDTPATGTLAATDIDSAAVTYSLVDTSNAHGTVVLTDDRLGLFSYTPDANYHGPASFTFRASDGQLDSNLATVSITVNSVNDAPLAEAGPDQTVDEGALVAFNATASFDVDDGDTLVFSWDFGDGATGSGLTPTHVYADNGIYTVFLTVTDSFGARSTDALTVTVRNVAPTPAIVSISDPLQEGSVITVRGTASDPAPRDTLTLAWTVFKDGSAIAYATGVGNRLRFTPDDNGSYKIQLTVTDDGGGVGTTQRTIIVRNVAPTATLTGDDPLIYDTATVRFGGLSDPSLADLATGLRYAFALDPALLASATYTNSSANAAATISLSAGIHTVYGRVFDKDGGFTSYSTSVVVAGVSLKNGVLQLYGTQARDIFFVSQRGSTLRVDSRLATTWQEHDDDDDDDNEDRHEHDAQHRHFSFNVANVTSILVVASGGNDRVHIGNRVTMPAFIDGGAGNDVLHGGGGNYTIVDLLGNNVIHRGPGSASILVGDGNNEIHTGGASDTIVAGNGSNRIWSAGSRDTITVGNGSNEIRAGTGNNVIVAGHGNNLIVTRDGNDRITTGNGNNEIQAGGGNDTVVTGGGNDTIRAGDGNDSIDAGDGNNVVNAGAGNDRVMTGRGNDVVDAGGGDDLVRGGEGNDSIQGGDGDDILLGGGGDDLLIGGGGRDLLIGGAGADRIVGNADDDVLIAGYTSWDNHDAALVALMREWTSNDSYAQRVAHLTAGTGLTGGYRLLGDDGVGQTVFDDNDVDVLTGSQGQDWFFANRVADNSWVLDEITDKAANELWNDIDF